MQLVREHINFKRGVEPMDAMGTGSKEYRQFQEFLEKCVSVVGGTYSIKTKKNGDIVCEYTIGEGEKYFLRYFEKAKDEDSHYFASRIQDGAHYSTFADHFDVVKSELAEWIDQYRWDKPENFIRKILPNAYGETN